MTDRTLSGETCFYCDALLPKRHELDHFPVPQCLGGEETVAACMNCHELKDRSMAGDWPADHFLAAILGVPLVKIELLYALMRGDRLLLDTYLDELLEDWQSLSSSSRIVLAKLVRIAIEVAHGERPDSLTFDLATLPEISVRRAA